MHGRAGRGKVPGQRGRVNRGGRARAHRGRPEHCGRGGGRLEWARADAMPVPAARVPPGAGGRRAALLRLPAGRRVTCCFATRPAGCLAHFPSTARRVPTVNSSSTGRWADAYRRAGLRYFPKLVSAVPFTPATGPRLLLAAGPEPEPVGLARCRGPGLARQIEASSVHVLFPTAADQRCCSRAGFMARKDCQFPGRIVATPTSMLSLASSRAEKRKKAKRERRRVAEAGITFRSPGGRTIDATLWDTI